MRVYGLCYHGLCTHLNVQDPNEAVQLITRHFVLQAQPVQFFSFRLAGGTRNQPYF